MHAATLIEAFAAAPFALSLLFVGMPHGAADGALAWRWTDAGDGAARHAVRWTALTAAYTAVIAASIAVLTTFPAVYLSCFLVVAVAHFGLAATRLHRDSPASGHLTAAAIVGLPFALRPSESAAVFDALAAGFGGDPLPGPVVLAAGVLGITAVASLVVIHASELRCGRRLRRRAVRGLVIATALLATTVVLPPLATIGLWFLAWHAWPEVLRIGKILGAGPGRPPRALTAHLAALPYWLPTLAALALLWPHLGLAPTPRGVALLAILAYAVLTPAHLIFQECHARARHPAARPRPRPASRTAATYA